MTNSDKNTTQVAICGGGPVGLMLALFLDRHGIRSVVFNTEETARWHPKGSTHNSRTMEHYRRLGFSEKVRALGLPQDHPTDVVYLTRFNAWELARIRMPSEREKVARALAAEQTAQNFEPVHRANQMYVEPLLFELARARPRITLRFGSTLEGFTEDTDGVSFRASSKGGDESWRADYLVGCDGGQSRVRRDLGIRYEGHSNLDQPFLGGKMVSTYIKAPGLYESGIGARRGWQYWAVNPELRTCAVDLNGRDEFLFWTRLPEGQDEPEDAAVIRAFELCSGVDVRAKVIAHRTWTAGVALWAERFWSGNRVFLAGDSVHLFTPTGGFGMNTGIEDVANLSWKLAAMLQGWGGPKLGASFEAERKPIAERNTSAARALAQSVGAIPVSAVMEQDTPEGAAARAEAGAFLSTFGEEFASIGVQLGARYDGSTIVCPDGTPPEDNYFEYRASSIPGGRAPHYWLDPAGTPHRRSLFDCFGTGFTLLRLGSNPPDAVALMADAKRRGLPLAVIDLPDAAARELYDCSLALIRPDQHVAWRGNALPSDCGAVLDRVSGF